MKHLRKFWLNINVLLIAVTLFAFISPSINPNSFWPSAFIGLAFPVLVFLNACFIIYWFFVKAKYSLYSIICLLVGASSIGNLVGMNSPKEVVKSDIIQIMSYNFKNGGEIYHSDKSIRKSKVDDFLTSFSHRTDMDVLCIQEVGRFGQDMIDKAFPSYQKTRVGKSGTVTLSRTPLIASGKLPFKNTANSCIWTDLILDFDTIRIYNVHLQSNQIREDEVDIELSQEYKKSFDEAKGVMSKYRSQSKRRASQVDILREHLDQSPYPVIVCGDFNEPPQSYAYHAISSKLKDSFTEKGSGIGATYAGRIPFLRIDYVFIDPSLIVLNHEVIKQRFSDHYPVIATLTTTRLF